MKLYKADDFFKAAIFMSLFFFFSASAIAQSPKNEYRYLHMDVFTDTPLSGNQLAVFLDPEELSDEQLIKLTKEMNFSETTFLYPARNDKTDFRVRIFTPSRPTEMPIAGHPTIGTVFALANLGLITPEQSEIVLELGIGPTPIKLEWDNNKLAFAWMKQRLPMFGDIIEDKRAVAEALGIKVTDFGNSKLPVQLVDCGAPFIMVPLATRDAVDRAVMDRQKMGSLIDNAGLVRRGMFLFSMEPGDDGATIYSRMLGFGVTEDPATGNASGPAGSYLVHYGLVDKSNEQNIISRQGVKMGRSSEIRISVSTSGDEITDVQIGGSAVLVSDAKIKIGN
ncbi:MAG: PhzF family phenazine biosynthesis protein [Kordiimonadaceae bacterium]|nr:PhzF family phenazine biosynthesis protein [Kordiimonadaceae bacterium]